MSVSKFFAQAPFGPDVILIMNDAFNRACKGLHDSGQPDLVKQVLAERIIAGVKEGKRDPHELCEEALKSLGIKAPTSSWSRDPDLSVLSTRYLR